jgi:GT2 family glycosyltransferase
MDISVIIVNYHSAGMVIDCVNSIFDKTRGLSYEIIVVDNASGDGSVECLRETFGDRIKLIASPENLGFGKANNLGAAQASGKYLFLLNPDTILINDAIGILHDYMEANSNVGVAGGNLYSPEMTPTPSFCRVFDDLDLEKKRASWGKLLGERILAKLHIGVDKPMAEFNHSESPEKVAYIFGADMMLPRAIFEKAGGFDPDFFMYGEEEELTWRITELGYDVMSVPQAKIIHLEGATLNAAHTFNPRQFKMRMTGTLTYYFKRFGKEGAADFFRIRSLRYDRLLKIAKLQGKYKRGSATESLKQYLAEAYEEFTLKGDN